MDRKKEVAAKKMGILWEAIKELEAKDMMNTLKDNAFEVIVTHPGIGRIEWASRLMRYYPKSIRIALQSCNSLVEVCQKLDELWLTQYHDQESQRTHTFSEWADLLCDDEGVAWYCQLVESNRKWRKCTTSNIDD